MQNVPFSDILEANQFFMIFPAYIEVNWTLYLSQCTVSRVCISTMLILLGFVGKEFTKNDYYPHHVVHPSVHMEQRDYNRADFREISYLQFFIDKVHQFRLWLKLRKITHTTHAWLQASTAKKRTAIFWVIMQLVVVISYRRFWTTYTSILKGHN